MAKKGKISDLPETLMIEDLEQVRVLADPLRSKILGQLCLDERTTKQVAEALGEKPTKLYHHVDALEKVGLIELVRTEPKRGTLEKYYRSVALRFEVSSKLFQSEGAGVDSPIAEMVENLWTQSRDEMRALMQAEGGPEELEGAGLVTFAEVHGSDEDMDELRKRLETTLEELAAEKKLEDVPPDARRFRLMLAFYPMDR